MTKLQKQRAFFFQYFGRDTVGCPVYFFHVYYGWYIQFIFYEVGISVRVIASNINDNILNTRGLTTLFKFSEYT